MGKVTSIAQREQAGSTSYDRFEYQVHWIAYHVINQLTDNPHSIVLCEFHDDMLDNISKDDFEFYQIKTRDEGNWTFPKLTQRNSIAGTNKRTKHSFLGYIFYNFLTFEEECDKCYFITNQKFNPELMEWIASVEDEYLVKENNKDFYGRLYSAIRKEFPDTATHRPFTVQSNYTCNRSSYSAYTSTNSSNNITIHR